MQKHLYFVCPTDHLETVINKAFKEENYYFTSLGNSVAFSAELVGQINDLIAAKGIREVSFVLSNRNQLIIDALKNRSFKRIRGLTGFYNEIAKQEKFTKAVWQVDELLAPVLSYYLSVKIREFKSTLASWSLEPINVDGKIYNNQSDVFIDVDADLFGKRNFNFN